MKKEEKEKKPVNKSQGRPRKRTKKVVKKEEGKAAEVKAEEKIEIKAEVKEVSPPLAPKVKKPQAAKKLAREFFPGTGRRKTAVAQARLFKGQGKIFLNGKGFKEYLCNRYVLIHSVTRPLEVTSAKDKFDVVATVKGGGIPAQADAVKMGIARALLAFNPEWKKVLRQHGLLTRDSRMKESKKYGHKRARKSFQYSKR